MQLDHIEYQSVPIRPVECLKEAKALIGEQYWLFVGISTVGLLIAGAAPFYILLGPMMCGIFLCFQDRIHGKRTTFERLFKGFDYFVETLIATLIVGGLTAVVIVPLYVGVILSAIGMSDDDALPVLLPIMFGLLIVILLVIMLVSSLFIFAYPLICFGGLKAMPAIKTSCRAALANFPGVLGLVLLTNLIWMSAGMCCVVPAYLVAPILIGSALMAYRKVFPDGFVNEQPLDASVLPDEGKPTPQPSKPNDFA